MRDTTTRYSSLEKLCLLLIICCVPFYLQAKTTLIHAGTLIDGVSNNTSQKMTIIIDGNQIEKVIKGYRKPEPNDFT